jgi:hypothetical protein
MEDDDCDVNLVTVFCINTFAKKWLTEKDNL